MTTNSTSYNLDANFIADNRQFTLEDSLEDSNGWERFETIVAKYGQYSLLVLCVIILIALIVDIDSILRDIIVIAGSMFVLGVTVFSIFYKK